MRDSEKNKTTIYYALRNIRKDKDAWGNTKDVTTYGNPQMMKLSVSANKGEASAQAFGTDIKYDREMITHDMTCPIDEFTRLWIDEPSTVVKELKTVFSEGDTLHISSSGIPVSEEKVDDHSIIDKAIQKVWSEDDTIHINTDDALITADESGFNVSGIKAHNYEVAAVSRSLNSILYAIRRVNVSR